MRALTGTTLILLVVFTALSIVFTAASGGSLLAVNAGPISVNLFDLLFFMSVVLLVREASLLHGQHIPPANRVVLALVLGYCAYQIAVVLPVAVIFHGLEPIAVTRQLESRLAMVLIPFVYLVGMKYVSPQRMVALVNVAAVCLAFYAMYKYATGDISRDQASGLHGTRELWGGAALAFGFLVLTSLFLRRPNALAYLMALIGLIGLVLTDHRSAYVALIATVPPLLINSRRAVVRLLALLLVVSSMALLVFAASPGAQDSVAYSLRTMFNPKADENAVNRVSRTKLGWDYFVENPLGDFQWSQRYYLVYVGAGNFEPHNFVIQLLGQEGIVSFAFVAGVIVATARIGWRNRRDRMSAVMLGYFAFYLIFCLFNTNLMNPANVLLLVLPIGVILSQNAALERSPDAAHDPVEGVERRLIESSEQTV